MSQMAVCGWCGHKAVMIPVSHEPLVSEVIADELGDQTTMGWRVFRCPGCNAPSLAQGFVTEATSSGSETFVAAGWYPTESLFRTYPQYVPVRIASVAVEAHACLTVKSYRGAVALARAVVESTAKAKGITQGSLKDKIDVLYERGFIYEHVKDAAHEVRFAGNEVAHGDLVDDPLSSQEAEAILELMDMVLDGVFVAPGKVAAQSARRSAQQVQPKV
ncbi:DUF4145 domain-containing protein [Microbispora sp. H13382]|uniref:DUF4145 domain-containing protein n=1 Tax=Microbispora sp. H13382 TaxID=2729112 RepID=UPI001602D9B5|nr:DUF4145 domain-containing protein [Microbispora sp. H13382]